MKVSNMEDFLFLSTDHSGQRVKKLVLIKRDTRRGALMKQIWMCPTCAAELVFEICDMVRSIEAAQGNKKSMPQLDFNLPVIAGAVLTGINTQQVQKYMTGQLGVNMSTDRNVRVQQTKVRKAIKSEYGERKIKNRQKHVAAV